MYKSIDNFEREWYVMDVVEGNFVWNSHKERANLLKHGVSFHLAAQAFSDPDIRIFVDDLHSEREMRYFAIAELYGRIITVRFVYRQVKIRIFDAGYWRKGKGLYEKPKKKN
jgi:uncharacterized protein